MRSQSPRRPAGTLLSVSYHVFDEGVLLLEGGGDLFRQSGSGASPGEPSGLLEAAADPGQRAEQPVGVGMVASLRFGPERCLADEARGLQAAGLGALSDAGELFGVQAEELGGGPAGGGHGGSEGAVRWSADPSTYK